MARDSGGAGAATEHHHRKSHFLGGERIDSTSPTSLTPLRHRLHPASHPEPLYGVFRPLPFVRPARHSTTARGPGPWVLGFRDPFPTGRCPLLDTDLTGRPRETLLTGRYRLWPAINANSSATHPYTGLIQIRLFVLES
jgi:hypothetical protein